MPRLATTLSALFLLAGMLFSCSAPAREAATPSPEPDRSTATSTMIASPSPTAPLPTPTLPVATPTPSPSPETALADPRIAVQPTLTPLPEPIATPKRGAGDLPWWNDRVFYELFVRSYQDSSGDGSGDLRGLISRLDYLNDGDPATDTDLGVTGLWLMPVSEATSYHGYDVVDYKMIEHDYGTSADFAEFISEAHRRGMVVIVDLVLNHTSAQHPWFLDGQKPGSQHEGWYIWNSDPPAIRAPSGASAWHPLGGRYYLGLFWAGMPDLNYQNGAVTLAMRDVIRYWIDEVGVDGFRLDAMRHLMESGSTVSNTPATHEWLRDYHRYVRSLAPDALTVGEAWDSTSAAASYVGDQVDLAFEFELASAFVNSVGRGYYQTLGQVQRAVLAAYPPGQYGAFLTNHDQNRVMDMVLDDMEGAKVAATLLLTNPGVPFIYYGEEIGMTGSKPDELIRTPMQWSNAANAGFTTGTPWEEINSTFETHNVASESADPESLLSHYRTLIRLRDQHPVLRAGEMTLLDTGNQRAYAYLRSGFEERLLVLVNLSDEPVTDYAIDFPSEVGTEVLTLTQLVGSFSDEPAAPSGLDSYVPFSMLPPHSYSIMNIE